MYYVARTMYYLGLDNLKQAWVFLGIWQLSTDPSVDLIWMNLVLEPDEQLSVRKDSLRPLDGVHVAKSRSEDMVFDDDSKQFDDLLAEHSCNQIWFGI